ncbi:MAG TPA: periplasmic heavy metal sensor [Bacteroidota bacterium]
MRTSMALLLALIMAGGAIALSQPDPAAHHAPLPQKGRREFMEKLGLNEKQKTDIAGLRTEMEKTMVGIQAKIKIARIDMRNLVAAESPDKGAIEGKMKEVNDLQYQAKKLTVDHIFAVYALLTPEQQKMFKGQLMKRLSGRGMRPMEHRWEGFQGGMPDEQPAPR